jgi:hypothetical protein
VTTKSFAVRVSAGLELGTGIALIVTPTNMVHLLFGAELSGGGIALGRVCGIGLLALGFATLPGRSIEVGQAIAALFLYNLLSSLYFAYLGGSGDFAGILLWPACFIHGLLALLLAAPTYKEVRRLIV